MFLLRLLALLPLPLLYGLSLLAYPFLYYLVRYRRAVVRDNLQHAFPGKSRPQRLAIEKAFYRHLANISLEIVKATRMTQQDFRRRVTLRNPELLHSCSEHGKRPVILVTLHQGNWEWMLHGLHAALEVPLDPIYKPLHNPSLDALAFAIRSRFGAQPVATGDAARDVLRRRGQFRLLAMVADQSPTRRERALWTGFLNRPAAFHTGPEDLARRADCALVFASCRRVRRGFYEVELLPLAATPGQEPAEYPQTRRYAELVEQSIRAQPETWLWSNRRWKRSAPQDYLADVQPVKASGLAGENHSIE